MRIAAALFVLVVLAPLARGEDVWRWKDASGTLHYSNQPEVAPADAVPVTTPLIIETDRMPGAPDEGVVTDVRAKHPRARRREVPHRIYTEQRLRFGCYTGGLLFAGGFAHPDDIATVGNCLPYLLGPEAWLNAAKAELALRANGIDWRQIMPMYLADQPPPPHRVTALADTD